MKAKQIILGVAIGFGLSYLWGKRKKKPCACEEETVEEEEVATVEEPEKKKPITETEDNPQTCEEAVKLVMRQMRFGTAGQRADFYKREVAKCQNMR